MIVDKINQYLSSEKLALNDAILAKVEKQAGIAFKRQFMDSESYDGKGKIRLSSIGQCTRKLAYGYHGIPPNGKTIDSRGKMVFFQGDLVELAIINLAKLAGCSIIGAGSDQTSVSYQVDDFELTGHPDGFLIYFGETYLVEIKSMASKSWPYFESGQIQPEYMAQIQSYMLCTGLGRTIIVGLNKDIGVMHEIIVLRDKAFKDEIEQKTRKILLSNPELWPDRDYGPDKKGYLDWHCSYCSHWGTCWGDSVEKVVVNGAYKLKLKPIKKEEEKEDHEA